MHRSGIPDDGFIAGRFIEVFWISGEGGLFQESIRRNVHFSYRPHDRFEALCAQFPEQAIHWIRWKGVGEWIGSSPELLLKKVDDRFETVALAGTLHSDQEELGREGTTGTGECGVPLARRRIERAGWMLKVPDPER